MDRKKKIAYKFFESNEKYLIEELQQGFKSEKYYMKKNIVNFFDGLFGKLTTLELFLEWVVSEKKIFLDEGTTFVYRDIGWFETARTYDETFSWTQAILEGALKGDICRWKYDGGKLTRVNNPPDIGIQLQSTRNQGMSPEQALELKMN